MNVTYIPQHLNNVKCDYKIQLHDSSVITLQPHCVCFKLLMDTHEP